MKPINSSVIRTFLPALGIACPLGLGKQAVSKALFSLEESPIHMKVSLLSGKEVPVGRVPFEVPEIGAEFQELRSRNNALLQLALDEISADVDHAKALYGPHRIGVVLGTSTSGMLEGEQGFCHKQHTGEWPANYLYTQQEVASLSTFAARYLKLGGPAYTISTACSSSSKALCSAKRLINAGICDAVITGGADTVCSLTLNGFDSLELLSEKVCNPFSKNRQGITIGEGAAVFLMTRDPLSAAHAVELIGYGESSDAYHISSPDPDGKGAEAAIRDALKMAALETTDISYINLHGTGTPLNDAMESRCIARIFGNQLPCSSTKGLTGHTLGAAGALEAAILWLALASEEKGSLALPPHIWDRERDPELASLHLVDVGERATITDKPIALMSNSFAFGGSNVSVILSKGFDE